MMHCRHELVAIAGILLVTAVLFLDGCTDTTEVEERSTPTSLIVSPKEVVLPALEASVQFSAQVFDQNGSAMESPSITWSSEDPSVAAVNTNGLGTATGNGTTRIIATVGTLSGTAAVTVTQSVSSVAVAPATATLVAFGDTARLTVEALDANGHAVAGAEFAWSSSDTSVIVVDTVGVVTAVANGTVTIMATTEATSGTARVTVSQEIDAVEVLPSSDTLVKGDTLHLSAKATDRNGHAVHTEFEWSSSNTSIAEVDGNGLIRAMAEGKVLIRATSKDIEGRAEITVELPDRLVVVVFERGHWPDSLTIQVDDSVRVELQDRIYRSPYPPPGHMAIGKGQYWSCWNRRLTGRIHWDGTASDVVGFCTDMDNDGYAVQPTDPEARRLRIVHRDKAQPYIYKALADGDYEHLCETGNCVHHSYPITGSFLINAEYTDGEIVLWTSSGHGHRIPRGWISCAKPGHGWFASELIYKSRPHNYPESPPEMRDTTWIRCSK